MIKHYINESVNILYASDENFANFVEANSNHLNEGSNQNDFISSILSADNSTLSESLIGFKNQILSINNDIREFELFEIKESLKNIFRIAKSSNPKSRRILASIAKKDYELFENIIQVTSKKNIHQLISEVNSLTLNTDEKQLNEVFGFIKKGLSWLKSLIFAPFKFLWGQLTKRFSWARSFEGFFKSLFFLFQTLKLSVIEYIKQKGEKKIEQNDIKDFKSLLEKTINSQLAKMVGQLPPIDEKSLPAFKFMADKVIKNLNSLAKNEKAAEKFLTVSTEKKGFMSYIMNIWKQLPAALKEVEDIKKTAGDEKARQALGENNKLQEATASEEASNAKETAKKGALGIGAIAGGGALAGAGAGALASMAGSTTAGLLSGALTGAALAGSGALIVAGLVVIAMAVKKMIGAPNKYFKGEPVETEETISGAPGSGVSGGGISRPQPPSEVNLMPQQIQGIASQIPNMQIPSGFNLGSFMQAPQAYPGLMPFYQVLQPNNLDNLTVGQLKALMQAFNQNKDKDLTDDVRQQIMQLLSGRGGVGSVQTTPTTQTPGATTQVPGTPGAAAKPTTTAKYTSFKYPNTINLNITESELKQLALDGVGLSEENNKKALKDLKIDQAKLLDLLKQGDVFGDPTSISDPIFDLKFGANDLKVSKGLNIEEAKLEALTYDDIINPVSLNQQYLSVADQDKIKSNVKDGLIKILLEVYKEIKDLLDKSGIIKGLGANLVYPNIPSFSSPNIDDYINTDILKQRGQSLITLENNKIAYGGQEISDVDYNFTEDTFNDSLNNFLIQKIKDQLASDHQIQLNEGKKKKNKNIVIETKTNKLKRVLSEVTQKTDVSNKVEKSLSDLSNNADALAQEFFDDNKTDLSNKDWNTFHQKNKTALINLIKVKLGLTTKATKQKLPMPAFNLNDLVTKNILTAPAAGQAAFTGNKANVIDHFKTMFIAAPFNMNDAAAQKIADAFVNNQITLNPNALSLT